MTTESKTTRNLLAPFRIWLASLLPGLFLIGYNIGTGSLTTMSKAGANYGTQLLWAVLLSCLNDAYPKCCCNDHSNCDSARCRGENESH